MLYPLVVLFVFFAFVPCNEVATITQEKVKMNTEICTSFKCAENYKNKPVALKGKLQKYTPVTRGKGANHMFWEWEIVLEDDISIPVESKNEALELSDYKNKEVIIEGVLFYGIVIGTVEGQHATGYRLDANGIKN